MKKSDTDKELAELIRSALDKYQEDYIPGAWEAFEKKRKRRRKIIFLRYAAAAAAGLIVAVLGIQFFVSDPVSDSRPEIAVNKSRIYTIPENRAETGSAEERNSTQNISPFPHVKEKVISQSDPVKNNPKIEQNIVGQTPDPETLVVEDKSILSFPADSGKIEVKSSDRSVADKNEKSVLKIDKSIEDQIISGNIAENAGPNFKERKVRIGINISPGITTSQSGSSFTYSGGVSTDVELFENILLSTGLQIEHQNIINGGNGFARETKADLFNLDIPLNLTWKFLKDKNKSFYVSGGVSSLAYLSEKYNSTIYSRQLVEVRSMASGVESVGYKVDNVETKTHHSEAPFSNFDLAGRVNLLFGMEQRLTPKLNLHIEPYLKIPVSGLATENLKFSTGGINCKISF